MRLNHEVLDERTPAPSQPVEPASIGLIAATLAEELDNCDAIFVASDEQRAEAVAAALRMLAPTALVVHCPSSDALPGDTSPATPANVGRRVAALRTLRQALAEAAKSHVALITTAEAAACAYPPPTAFDAEPPALTVGDALDGDSFAATLEDLGYFADDRVDEPGEMAVRGQVVDLFPADATLPVRIEVEDGHIVAIRTYDPVTQLGEETLDRIEIGRAREPSLGEDWVTLFAHLPDAPIASDPDAPLRRDRFVGLARDAAGARSSTLPLTDRRKWDEAIKARPIIKPPTARDAPRFVEGKAPLRAFSRAAREMLESDGRVLVLGTARDLRFLKGRLAKALAVAPVSVASWAEFQASPAGTLALLEVPVERGWLLPQLMVVAASDLLGSRASAGGTAGSKIDMLHGEIGEIRVGDIVVHEDFGIARIAGLETIDAGGVEGGDAIVLEYAGGAKRLLPVGDADRLWRYGADADAVTLDRLDGSSWEKRRIAIDRAIAESARGLTELAAERGRRSAEIIDPDPAAFERFVSGFPFTETPDQARAISQVRADLAAGKPMDRLVVGDVGYGKTEVAIRAAALTALAGKQVVIAAPTTVLVRQHLESFRRRFEGTKIVVAGLSRLSTAAEKKAVKEGLADGSIHVAVGTGALGGAKYHDLALVVIDEEQRFGAADKGKLRGLSENCHLLTLTATPIPRTLQSALVGLQQVSIIATPPAKRQPIRTSVGEFDPTLIRTALMREKGRGGQSFVVVSRIEDMAPIAEQLSKIVPDLLVREAHGKMPAADIDDAMVRFAGGDGDVLLATNIIEAGLDVPRANTMIVWRADRFGLSQLHQLRGRVGRGSRRGQILLLTDPKAKIAQSTLKRLQTLQAFDRLGAGFAISARDLDMRGAGDLLGDEQAGHMKLIGVDLYQHLLDGALRTARGETVEIWTPDLRLGVSGNLPDAWIPEVDVRLSLYTRLARLTDMTEVEVFEAELEDRFGAIPVEVQRLLEIARVRILARLADLARIDAGPAAIALTPRRKLVAPESVGLEQQNDRYLLREPIEDADARLDRTHELIGDLLAAG